MGLDMYLKASLYVGGWDLKRESAEPAAKKEVALFDKLAKLTHVTPSPSSPSFESKTTVGYWRKANAIHKWFVDNVQDGRDECQDSSVSRDQLQSLLDLCLKVKKTVKMIPGGVVTGETASPATGGVFVPDIESGQVIENAEEIATLLPCQGGFFFGSTDYDQFYMDDIDYTITMLQSVLSNPALKEWDFEYHASW